MNLTDSLLGAICLVFLLVLLGTLTQERAASRELGRSAELMDDLASAAGACARDHESEPPPLLSGFPRRRPAPALLPAPPYRRQRAPYSGRGRGNTCLLEGKRRI